MGYAHQVGSAEKKGASAPFCSLTDPWRTNFSEYGGRIASLDDRERALVVWQIRKW
jgi:hypothetical protein